MPRSYADAFDQKAIEEHARIAGARGNNEVHAKLWRILPQGLAVLIVVARDRSGLLATISTCFALHRLTVTTAMVHSRKLADGTSEAFDLFWVRRRDYRAGPNAGPSVDEVDLCLRTLTGFVQAEVDPAVLPSLMMRGLYQGQSPRVFFDPNSSAPTLVVEAPDAPGLLKTIALTLYRCRVSIVSSEIRTEGDVARDRFVLDEATLNPADGSRKEELIRSLSQALSQWQLDFSLSA